MTSMTNNSAFEKLSADKGGEFGSTSLPVAAASSLREQFDAMSVRITIDGQPLDVAVPSEAIGRLVHLQEAFAQYVKEIGGRIATWTENKTIANYLIDCEACSLLTKEASGEITETEAVLLTEHRQKWEQDKEAELRAKTASPITEKETALLDVYRTMHVRDDSSSGIRIHTPGIAVGVHLCREESLHYIIYNGLGSLIVRSCEESK